MSALLVTLHLLLKELVVSELVVSELNEFIFKV